MNKKIISAALAAALALTSAALPVSAAESDNASVYTEDDESTGWQSIDGDLYYFRENGKPVTKNTTIDGIRYKFTSTGVCTGKFTGMTKTKGKSYYYKKGVLQKGFFTVKGNIYYAHEDGMIRTGWASIYSEEDGKHLIYYFDRNGVLNDQKAPANGYYIPNSVNEWLLDYDLSEEKPYVISLNDGLKYVPFHRISYIKEVLENERDNRFLKEGTDEKVLNFIPGSSKYDRIIIGTGDASDPNATFSIIKTSKGNVYFYGGFLNQGYGCKLDDNTVYDELVRLTLEDSENDDPYDYLFEEPDPN